MPVPWLTLCYILVLLYAPLSIAHNDLMFEARSERRIRTWILRALIPLYLIACLSIAINRPEAPWGIMMFIMGVAVFLCDIPFCFGASAFEEVISHNQRPRSTIWHAPYVVGRVLCFAQLVPWAAIVLGLLAFQ